MKKELELTLPESYADITLKQWLELQKEMANYEGDDEAVTAVMLQHLCGLDPKYLKALNIEDYVKIRTVLNSFMGNVELPLQKFITIGDVEYGFEPNLSKMSYGAYADITKFEVLAINDNWAKIMNILYRPVYTKNGDMYTIRPYDGDLYWEKFLSVPMDVHFGALFFLLNLQRDLLNSTLNSLKEMEVPHNIKSILVKSGQLIQQSSNSPMEISSNLTKLLNNL
jgi:hypothetical protein